MDYSWAKQYPEIFRVCTLFRLAELKNPIKFNYNALTPYMQEGPQCGLVALAMCIGNPTRESIDKLYQKAKELKYTYNGEMFSAMEMCNLAQIYMPDCKIELHTGNLQENAIIDLLLQGGFILVPYDSDRDHSPCLQNGHKAHWACLSGIVVTEDNIFILARHGKSKNVAVWNLTDLANSNAQLEEFSPDRKLSGVEYKLPDGGIAGSLGLKNKSVLIYK